MNNASFPYMLSKDTRTWSVAAAKKHPGHSKLPPVIYGRSMAPPELPLALAALQMPQNGFLSDWIVAPRPTNHLGLQTGLSRRHIPPLVKGGRG